VKGCVSRTIAADAFAPLPCAPARLALPFRPVRSLASRAVPRGRTRRTLHAVLRLASDAGFTYAGAKLPDEAENSVDKRREHRTWAYGSMATTLAAITVIKLWPEEERHDACTV